MISFLCRLRVANSARLFDTLRGGRVATSYKFSVAERLLLQLTHQGNMQLVSSCFCTPHKMTGHFVGAPGMNFNPRRK